MFCLCLVYVLKWNAFHRTHKQAQDPSGFHVHGLHLLSHSPALKTAFWISQEFSVEILTTIVFVSNASAMNLALHASATKIIILLPPMSGWGGSQQRCLGPWWWQRNSWGSSEPCSYKRSLRYSSITSRDPAQRHVRTCSLVNGHRRGQHPHAWDGSVSQQGYIRWQWMETQKDVCKVTNCAAILMNFFMSWTLLQSVGHNSTSVITHSWTSLQRCSSSSSAAVWPLLPWRLKVK